MSWFLKLMGSASGNVAEVNGENSLKIVDCAPSGTHYTVAAKTGVIAAAATAGAALYAMRLNPGYTGKAYIDTLKLRFTTITAFTTPVTQTRSIVLTRGAGAAATAGTAITSATKKDTAYGLSQFDVATGGDMRIGATGALTVTGITFEATNLGELTLAHVGAAGGYYEHVYEFSVRNHSLELNPGEVFAVRVGPSAMDAAGTFGLGVEVGWRESLTEA